MAVPVTLTVTMQDGSTTVATPIPKWTTASNYVTSFQQAGGIWDSATPDILAGATFWPWTYFKKAVTS
jgi:hypothetical protein